MRFTLPTAIVALLLTVVLVTPQGALAEELTGTLKKIHDTGKITIGHRVSSIPFSFYNAQKHPIGHAQDYSQMIVRAIKAKLGRPNLEIQYLPITPQNRIPLLQSAEYDFECGSTSHTTERQKLVDFSNTIFIASTRLLVHVNSGIENFADLRGKAVAVTAGTTSEKLLTALNTARNMSLRILSARDHGSAFRSLESGRVVAFFTDDALLAGERAKAKKPKEWVIVGAPQSYEAYACMLPKGDAQFKKLVDSVIAEAQLSGAAQESFTKWFQSPIPPHGTSLDFPLPEKVKSLYSAPNDQPYP